MLSYDIKLVQYHKDLFQIFGINYADTFSLNAKFISIYIFLAISVHLGLIIHKMDVDTAFLNADINEVIWVKIPEGTKLAANDDGNNKLQKSTYGLKKSKLSEIGTMTLINISLTMTSRDQKLILASMSRKLRLIIMA